MHMLCYLPADLPSVHPVRRLLLNTPAYSTREIYDSLNGLERRLSRPGDPDLVLALVFTCEADLDRVMALAHLCLHRDILVIIPQAQPALQTKAHRLRPRFITSLDGDPEEFSAVLRRLADGYQNGRRGPACNRITMSKQPPAAWAPKASF